MKKFCKIIIAIALVLVLVIAGFFYYNKMQEDRSGLVSFDNFKKIESKGKIFVENKDGLRFMIPEGWELGEVSPESISTSNFIPDNSSLFPTTGCLINVDIESLNFGDTEYAYYDNLINGGAVLDNIGEERREIIEISGLKSLKDTLSINNNTNNQISYIEIVIPHNNKLYHFQTYISGSDKDHCSKEFDSLLETINFR